ncbi:hypothetical protein E1B28_013058 [Marasmius oreades]|uniref:CxC2-like cysteine cluster KDZ transposase-associated domain-containing protein n=1 Tax=Marasmius oreades TaxID=181124 RepID=A0A9P7UNM2_9AGAR|nr:uncharacterized protein E1B28_013058 [Marasmius oreades]KAG7087076.1 hypothetical protein E1B28_013058 [Marasmius oreades]
MSKAKAKERCHDTTASGLKNTTVHQFYTQSKHRTYERSLELSVPKSTSHQNNGENPEWEECMGISSDMSYGETVEDELPEEEPGKLKVKPNVMAKRYLDSDAPLLTWAQSYRDKYLDWSLLTEGRGRDFDGSCSRCMTLQLPFDVWIALVYGWSVGTALRKDIKTNLFTVSRNGVIPPIPFARVLQSLIEILLSWTGLEFIPSHWTSVAASEQYVSQHLQLMERGWWPGSYKEPCTAATFNLLCNFHIINLQCQTPPSDFVKALEQITDGYGIVKLPDRAAQFMLVLRQFRNIKMAKRAGRGHDPSGMSGTMYGSATIPCRACPDPHRNLPADWEKAPADDRFLYALFLSEDANFKQKARSRPNNYRDPVLGPGWGCFVPHDIYMEEITKRTDQTEISNCVGFQSIATTNTKKSRGLRATGVGAVSCSRHETFRPNGMGDLQVGEQYINMDFLALYNLIGCTLLMVYFSYDIACQWMQHFHRRMQEFPAYMQLSSGVSVVSKVPKFHLPAHGSACLAKFAFNYTEGAGKTDGEGVERNWSWLNECARSLSMMTLGARTDTMDDFTNFWNWRKTVGLETSLLKKVVNAIPEAVINARAYSAFSEALQDDYRQHLLTWQTQVVQWENGLSQFCPYNVTESDITVAKVKKALAEEEHRREMAGESTSLTTANQVIIEGLDIEDTQQHLIAILAHTKLSEYKETSIQAKRTTLLHRLRKYYASLIQHMPSVQLLIDAEPSLSEALHPEQVKLFLPSTLDPSLLWPSTQPQHASHPSGQTTDTQHAGGCCCTSCGVDGTIRCVICPSELISLEDRLRFAQAHEALSRLRAQLRARTVAYKNSSRVIASQGMYVKLRALKDQIETKVKALTVMYRRARAALLVLRGEGDWSQMLKELKDEDVRGISERLLRTGEKEELKKAQELVGVSAEDINAVLDGINTATVPVNPTLCLGQSSQHLSWIWFTHRMVVEGATTSISGEPGSNFDELQESLRSEWCKARARARRSREELMLVEEEMHRSIEFCKFQSEWWKQQINRRPNIPSWLQEGLTAYASEHSEVELVREVRWTNSWAAICERSKLILQYLSDPKYNGLFSSLSQLEVKIDMREEDEGDYVDDD